MHKDSYKKSQQLFNQFSSFDFTKFYNRMQKNKETMEILQSQECSSKPIRPGVKNRRQGIYQQAVSKNQRMSFTLFDVNIKQAFKRMLQKMMELIVLNKVDNDLIKEQWENGEEHQDSRKEIVNYLFFKVSLYYFVLELLLFLSTVFMVWFYSIQLVFQTENQDFVPYLSEFVIFLDIFIILNTATVEQGREIKNRWKIFKTYAKGEMIVDILIIINLIVTKQVANMEVRSVSNIMLVLVLLMKSTIKYDNIKPFIDHNFAKEHVTLVTSFAFLIAMGHLFALMLYLAGTKTNEQLNWLTESKNNLRLSQWDTKYIFSLYWAFTTMVTVGYGDITPQNKYQVIVVIIVEILGTSIFGYMINIIGMTLSEMKSKDEALEKELTITDKMSKCFSIKDDLTYRLKSFLKNNHKVDSSFSIAEEKKLIEKLNPVLKQQLLEQTNSKVIKKSIFFLTQFSRSLQNKLSVKLMKKVFQPSQPLVLQLGEESIYIVEQGSVDILLIKHGKHKIYYKKAKMLCSENYKQNAGLNAYGFTATVTGRSVNIRAVSKTFTIAYKLKKEDLQQSISSHFGDCQALYELRDRFLAIPRLEQIEVPQLRNPRLHFYPNKQVLLRRERKKSRRKIQQRTANKRSQIKIRSIIKSKGVPQVPQTVQMLFQRTSVGVICENILQEMVDISSVFESMKSYNKYIPLYNFGKITAKYNRLTKKLAQRKSNQSFNIQI